MVRSRILVVLFFIVFALGVAGVDAGDRHHNQSVCDESDLFGAAYGTCHVYCEALDCDGPPNPRRERACERALDRFFDLTGTLPPCEPLCPCAAGWLSSEFLPDEIAAAVCDVQTSDYGQYYDLRLEGTDGSVSAASYNIFDDDFGGFHSFGCFSELYAAESGALSEDSGNFDMFTSFLNEGDLFDRQQNDMYSSCKAVFERIIEETGAECVTVDKRSR